MGTLGRRGMGDGAHARRVRREKREILNHTGGSSPTSTSRRSVIHIRTPFARGCDRGGLRKGRTQWTAARGAHAPSKAARGVLHMAPWRLNEVSLEGAKLQLAPFG